MKILKNNRGAVIVFLTLMIVLLLFLVGMGLDSGLLTYVRSQGQAAVDAAALAGASAIGTGDMTKVEARVAAFNSTVDPDDSTNNSIKNDYVGALSNPVGSSNIILVQYDWATGSITRVEDIAVANGVRVALEKSNPYTDTTPETDIDSPLFLTPLINLFGFNAARSAEISVSAVAAAYGLAGLPLAVEPSLCNPPTYPKLGVVYYQTPSGGDPPNNSGWTTFTVSPASKPTLIDMMNNENCDTIPPLVVGESCLYMNNGQITPVLQEVVRFIDQEVWVPVVPDAKNFNQCQDHLGWAKIKITEVVASGSPKYVKGDLLDCNFSGYPDPQGSECVATVLVRDRQSGM